MIWSHRCRRLRSGFYVPFGARVRAHHEGGPSSWLVAGAGKRLVSLALRIIRGWPILSQTSPQRRTLYRAIVDFFPELGLADGRGQPRDCLGPWSELVERDRVRRSTTDLVIFGSADQPGSLEGATYAWGCLDEPRLVRHEAWRIFNSRIRDNRSAKLRRSVAGVPAMGWMFEEWGKPAPNRVMIKARTADNPHLPPGYIESLNLSDKLAQAISREFVVLSGVVFWTYDPRESVVDVEPDSSRPTRGALDFGGRRPAFLVIQDVEGLGEVIVEEVGVSDTLEQVHASQCAEFLQSYGLTIPTVFGPRRPREECSDRPELYRDL